MATPDSHGPPLWPAYVLLSEAPPLKAGGHGCSVLSWNWVEMAGADLKLIVTRRLDPGRSKRQIAGDLPVPTLIYPDLSQVQFPQRATGLKFLLEVLLVFACLPRIAARIRASGANRIFAFFGGSAWFLLVSSWVAKWSRLPLDIYLVDDLEESARLSGQPLVARFARWLEPRVLRRADRVFTISPGYCEHLLSKYDVRSQWLPIAIPQTTIEPRRFQPQTPDVRDITFIGAINPLYVASLRDLFHAIRQWNEAGNPYQFRLLLMTYSERQYIEKELGSHAAMEVQIRPPPEEFHRRLRGSWAIFLPYSFEQKVRVMVSTSFPTKLVDAFPAGRPILVYGPAYASIPRYFADHGLPVCVTSPDQLPAALSQIAQADNPALVQRYEAVMRQFHSAANLRSILARPDTKIPHSTNSWRNSS